MTTLSQQIERYLNYCQFQKRLSEKTLKAYKIDLHQFCSFLQDNLHEPNKEGVEKYTIWLHHECKPKTVKRKIACLKTFFSFLEFEGLCESNPFLKLKIKFNQPFVLPKTLSLETIQRVFQAAYLEYQNSSLTEYQRKIALRDAAVLELLFATGARVSEICSLNKSDIDFIYGVIKINGKGSKERLIQIGNSDVLKILKQYNIVFEEQINSSNYFFVNKFNNRLSEQSVRNIIKKYADKCGITTHITPHMFRHTFATLLLEEDVDIRYIQKFLGHSSIVTTQIYTHVTSKKQKQILVAKHPRNKLSFNAG